MTFSYDHLKWQIVKNDLILSRMEGEFPCNFCKKYDQCYYHEEIHYISSIFSSWSFSYYICEETYNQVLDFKKLYQSLPLYHFLLIYYLCEDVKNIIVKEIYKETEIKCVKNRQQKRQEREDYLNFDFTNLTIIQLRQLMDERKLYYKSYKIKYQYINALKNDVESKRHQWKYDPI